MAANGLRLAVPAGSRVTSARPAVYKVLQLKIKTKAEIYTSAGTKADISEPDDEKKQTGQQKVLYIIRKEIIMSAAEEGK